MGMKVRKPLVIVGAGGFGREVAWLVQDINRQNSEWELLGFVDDKGPGITVEGIPILGPTSYIFELNPVPWVALAIADAKIRYRLMQEVQARGIEMASLVHPSVIMSDFNDIGSGSIICAGTIITTNVKLGRASIVNLGCFVGHDTVLGDCVSMMPATNLAGEVKVGTGTYFGLNACVINRKTVGEWCVIGAGAVVVDDIPANSLAVGVPARVIKKLDPDKGS
ncbi:MAG: acetyltransferase [Syntrophothermus sp.]|uniref:acetyltransferase n=1 Tax=Syntrophothermus sp. TaxID=2736299 RepID=UPI00257B40A1|nr:acetyltransferase [Syntrophothermus sp.]NSW84590.1 acetyltransferase [Syntrophothermus sp.]